MIKFHWHMNVHMSDVIVHIMLMNVHTINVFMNVHISCVRMSDLHIRHLCL